MTWSWWIATWVSLVTLANVQALRSIREEIVRCRHELEDLNKKTNLRFIQGPPGPMGPGAA